ncbi:MAG: hypothetical protein PVJ57_20675 [Phycisphaerae bacterium]
MLASLLVAAMVFLCVGAATFYVIALVTFTIAERFGLINLYAYRTLTVMLAGTLWSVSLVFAGLLARRAYALMRWQDAELGGRYCVQCRYDLTGNVSGRCPECGLDLTDDEDPGRA